MTDSRRVYWLSRVLWLSCVVASYVVAFVDRVEAQPADRKSPEAGNSQEDGGPLAGLSQPADWSMEPTEAPALATIVEGSTLYLKPVPSSHILALLPGGQLPLLESRAPWVKVRYGHQLGWVDLETPRRALDVAIYRASENAGDGAESGTLNLPTADWYQLTWGPYQLFSLVKDRRVLDYLGRAAEGHAELYFKRFGLGPGQAISGSVVVLDKQERFIPYQRWNKVELVENAFFLSPEFVYMYPGTKSKRELSAILIHQLTHLLNWQIQRELGTTHTPLPPWLNEGMSDDLALSVRSHQGELAAEPLGPENLRYGPRLGRLLHRLASDIFEGSGYAPSLRELVTIDPVDFRGAKRKRFEELASLWVRYLLSGAGDEVAERFRGYLAKMFRGGSPHPDELAAQLGRDLTQIEGDFRGWLMQQQTLFEL